MVFGLQYFGKLGHLGLKLDMFSNFLSGCYSVDPSPFSVVGQGSLDKYLGARTLKLPGDVKSLAFFAQCSSCFTFQNERGLRDVAAHIKMDRLVLHLLSQGVATKGVDRSNKRCPLAQRLTIVVELACFRYSFVGELEFPATRDRKGVRCCDLPIPVGAEFETVCWAHLTDNGLLSTFDDHLGVGLQEDLNLALQRIFFAFFADDMRRLAGLWWFFPVFT